MNRNYYITVCLLIISFSLSSFIVAQKQTTLENDQSLLLTLQSGLTFNYTDYTTPVFAPHIRFSIEYFPLLLGDARIGLKGFGGGLRLRMDDSRQIVSTNDGLRTIPENIRTDMIEFGGALVLSHRVFEFVYPTISIGFTSITFSPKTSDGKVLTFNKSGFYDKNFIAINTELGITFRITERINLSLSGIYYTAKTDYLDDISASKNEDSFISGLVGISYCLFGNFDDDNDGVTNANDMCPDTPKGVKVDQFGCPVDSDKDGIPDYLDKCPDSPKGVVVDEFGCPKDSDKDGVPDYLDKCPDTALNLKVDQYGCPDDKDKDGVSDYRDKCPDTPDGIEVDEFGCPKDSDQDGVPDYLDKCPDTPAKVKVDKNGCPESASDENYYQFILRGEDAFNNGSSTLKESIKLVLNEIAFYIQNHPNSKWRIEGHMDNQGSSYTIKKLSYDRAKSVHDYLVSNGVNAEQLTVYGLGDSFPIGNNNTIEGRNANRRVMIIKED